MTPKKGGNRRKRKAKRKKKKAIRGKENSQGATKVVEKIQKKKKGQTERTQLNSKKKWGGGTGFAVKCLLKGKEQMGGLPIGWGQP